MKSKKKREYGIAVKRILNQDEERILRHIEQVDISGIKRCNCHVGFCMLHSTIGE